MTPRDTIDGNHADGDCPTDRQTALVGDSKLISRGNVLAMNQAEVQFIGPAAKSYLPAERLSMLDREAVIPVEYVAERDLGKPVEQRGVYRVLEGVVVLAGKRAADPDLHVRCVFVWSSARAEAAGSSRAKKLERARGDLERLERGLGGRYYPDAAAVNERLRVIGRQHNVAAYLRAEVGRQAGQTDPDLPVRSGRPERRDRQRRLVRAVDQPGASPG